MQATVVCVREVTRGGLCRVQGLGEEHLASTVEQLGIKGSGWDVVSGKRSWRKRKLAERPTMQSL